MSDLSPQPNPTLIRLGKTNFYFILSPQGDQIIEQFYKPQLAATIAAIQQTLALKPDSSLIDQDIVDIELSVARSELSFDRKQELSKTFDRLVASLNADPNILETVRLQQRLARLQSLYAQMEK